MEQVTRDTPDILEYLDFEYYDWCWYNNNARLGEPKLGRWLGVAYHMGALMMYWILTEQGTVIACSTVSRLTLLEAHVENTKVQLQAFDAAMKEQMNDPANVINEGGKNHPWDWTDHPYEDDPDYQAEFNDIVSNGKAKEANEEFSWCMMTPM